MNLPNKLTILRILLVPIMVILKYIPIPGEVFGISVLNLILLFIFVIASLTDTLDGYLARKNNEVTNFGKFLDPIADKILVITALVILLVNGVMPFWVIILVVFREFVITGYRLIVVEKGGKVIAASNKGKIKTVTTMIAIIFGFLTNSTFFGFAFENLTGFNFAMNFIYTFFLSLAVIYTIVSAVDYLKDWQNYINLTK